MNTLFENNNENGFTIIEVMIAIVVFAIGILAVAVMQLGAVKGNSGASRLTEATVTAQNQMEQLMSLDYTDPKLSDVDNDKVAGLNDVTNPDGTLQVTNSASGIYNVFWNVAVDSPVKDSKQIRVIVRWQQNGKVRTVTLNSVKSSVQ